MIEDTSAHNSSEAPNTPSEETREGHKNIFGEAKTDSVSSKDTVPSEQIPNSLETELQETKEKWLRAEAENQNLRNRHKKELDDIRLYAVQKFARDLVDSAENMRRGIESLPKFTENEDSVLTKMREGFESIERSFLTVLEKNGIQYNDPTGSTFDAHKHQAMAEEPSSEHPSGTVIRSWTPTWTLNGRLLKPAMVVVSKRSEANNNSTIIDKEPSSSSD